MYADIRRTGSEWLLPVRLGYREATLPRGGQHLPALPAVFVRPYLSVRDRTYVMSGALHHDELEIDLALVRALVDRSHPDFAALPLRQLQSSGSTNALFRLGDDLLVRLPRQPGGSAEIDKEAIWLPQIAPSLPVAVPRSWPSETQGLGTPSGGRWCVGSKDRCRWSRTPAFPRSRHGESSHATSPRLSPRSGRSTCRPRRRRMRPSAGTAVIPWPHGTPNP